MVPGVQIAIQSPSPPNAPAVPGAQPMCTRCTRPSVFPPVSTTLVYYFFRFKYSQKNRSWGSLGGDGLLLYSLRFRRTSPDCRRPRPRCTASARRRTTSGRHRPCSLPMTAAPSTSLGRAAGSQPVELAAAPAVLPSSEIGSALWSAGGISSTTRCFGLERRTK